MAEEARPTDELAPDGAVPAGSPYRRRWAALAVLCVGLSVVSIDNTILTTALPALSRELNASESDLARIADAYTITFAALLLFCGSLADRKGRKGVLLTGLVAFGITSVSAALSPSPGWLVANRVLMGAAGALIMPATLSILMAMFPREEQPKALGIWTAALGLGIASGPLAGGILLHWFGWESVFLVNIPVCAVAAVAAWRIVPTSRDPAAPPADVLGAVLWTVGIGMVVFSIIEAGEHSHVDAVSVILATVGVLLLVSFILWQRRALHPMLDLSLFRNPRFTVANVAVAMTQFALYGLAFIASQYLQLVLGYSALQAGLMLLPSIVLVAVVSPFSDVTLRKVGTKVAVSGGLALVAAGLVVGTFLGTEGPIWAIVLLGVLIGTGLGFALTPAEEAVLGSVPPEKLGVGSGMNDTTLELGGGLGIAVLGSLMAMYTREFLARSLDLPPDVKAEAGRSLASAIHLGHQLGPGPGEDLVSQARLAFTDGMQASLWVAASIVAAGAALAAWKLPARAVHPGDGSSPSEELSDHLG